jgi:hypothetical protein
LVVAKVRERLALSKQMVKKMDVERFNLKQLNEKEFKEQYQVTIKNKFAALENLDDAAFDVTGQRLIRFSISFRCWRKSGSIMAQYISYL